MKKCSKIYLYPLVFLVLCISSFFYWNNRWHYIVIHHTAGDYGNITHLQNIHAQRQSKDPLRAIAYHYIIGNGNGMKDGEIASDRRKKYNIWGVHVSKNNVDKNFRGIGISIVGNLEKKAMTGKQYQSLLRLTRDLMKEYHIKFKDILFHGKIPKEQTKCPGKFFPYSQFKKDLSSN